MVEGSPDIKIVNEELFNCSKCEGFGYIVDFRTGYESTCPKCLGFKKLDWVESITGKRPIKAEWAGTTTTYKHNPFSMF